jgi:hypothetical protein
MSEHPLFTEPPHVRLHLAMRHVLHVLRVGDGPSAPHSLTTDYRGAAFNCLYHECSGLSHRLHVQLVGDVSSMLLVKYL